jgi:predicted dienelactone hydrolase
MSLTTHPASTSRALALGATALRRPRLLAAVVAALLATGAAGLNGGAATAAAGDGAAADLRVGHTVERIVVPGSTFQGERRNVDVHLWYPADHQGLSDLPKSVYTSALHGRLLPAPWDPLSWTIEAEIAREDAAIDPRGKPYPVIVFSHGSVNDPVDYAHTLELIAGAGFVVAAPSHVNNTQDDVRIDFVNTQAGVQWFACNDGRPSPCSRANVPRSMQDRVNDIRHVLNSLPGWFGDRVDVSRAGVLGHSRGTVTALAAAGGSTLWGFGPEPRVKAIMGLAIGAPAVTFGADLANVTVPTLLVAGALDQTSPQAVSEAAFEQITSTEKAFVSIKNATHRSFDSTYCDQAQAAGAIAQNNPRAILDLQTIRGIVRGGLDSVTAPTSGKAMDYCSFATFTNPANIRPLVASLTGFNVTPDNVPTTGLDSDEVKQGVKELAVTFFGTVLKRVGNDEPHFTRYLAPKWLEKHVPMVGSAEAFAGADAICPPGQAVDCAD